MRAQRVFAGGLLLTCGIARSSFAQAVAGHAASPPPWRIAAEGGPLYARARGTLAAYLAAAYGVGFRVHAAPPGSRLGAHVEGEFMTFGQQTRTKPYLGAAGGPSVSITTGSRTFTLTAGPELRLGWNRVGLAVGAGAGLAYFANTGAVDGLGDPARFRRAATYGTFTWTLRGGAAGSFRLGRSANGARLELGAQFVQAGPTSYLREYHLPAGIISGIYLYPSPIRPSYVVLSLGVSAGV